MTDHRERLEQIRNACDMAVMVDVGLVLEACDIAKRVTTQRDAAERTIKRRDAELQVLYVRARAMRVALEFAEGAIGDAVYTEDGLDGDAGKAVLDMINPLIRTPEEMEERAKEIAKWPVI